MSYIKPRAITVTIASGDTTPSDAVPLLDSTLLGFITPAALTSDTMTFTVCATADGTFVPLLDSADNTPTVTITTSSGYAITGSEADALAPWAYFKPSLNAAEAAERTFTFVKK